MKAFSAGTVLAVLLASAALLAAPGRVAALDPCAEAGHGCRAMTAAEIGALAERFSAVQALLPAPDPARYAHDGAGEGSTMPFVSETRIPGAALTCTSWPAGCFTDEDAISFGYDARAATPAGKPRNILEAARSVAEMMAARVEVLAWLRPHPHRLDGEGGKCVDVPDPDAVRVEKSATFLSWETDSEGSAALHLVFGPRSCKEAETERVEKTAKAFAPVVSIEVQLSGPAAEVAALKKKIDRAAFAKLLGPMPR